MKPIQATTGSWSQQCQDIPGAEPMLWDALFCEGSEEKFPFQQPLCLKAFSILFVLCSSWSLGAVSFWGHSADLKQKQPCSCFCASLGPARCLQICCCRSFVLPHLTSLSNLFLLLLPWSIEHPPSVWQRGWTWTWTPFMLSITIPSSFPELLMQEKPWERPRHLWVGRRELVLSCPSPSSTHRLSTLIFRQMCLCV